MMFEKPPREPNPPEVKDLPDLVFSIKPTPETTQLTSQPELVTVTEKISKILSPYFIVLVGLFLYDRNGFIGFILVGTGVVSILGFSWSNLPKVIEEVKNFFRST
jgi:hypothetical protein